MDEVDDYVREVARRLWIALGENLVAVYLHGSAAMDAFVPSRSDVDVLAVTRGPPATAVKRNVADVLSEDALPCPGVGLEISIVTLESASTASDRPAFEMHLNTHESKVVDGQGHGGDPDLLAHFAMTRARGMALLGPAPEDVIAPVDRARLLRSLADDLAWAVDRELGGYAVLNACRTLRLAREWVPSSKPEGGRWALDQGIADPDVVIAALHRQAGMDEDVDGDAAAAFATRARDELLAVANQ